MTRRHSSILVALVLAVAATVVAGLPRLAALTGGAQDGSDAAAFQFDATWPKPLPDNWTLGNVVGVAVDARDHIWIVPTSGQPERAGAGRRRRPAARRGAAAPPRRSSSSTRPATW